MSEAEVEALPDPDLFRDAVFLAASGTWSPQELDATDVQLLALVKKIRSAKVNRA